MRLVFGILIGAAALWAQPQPPPAPWRGAGPTPCAGADGGVGADGGGPGGLAGAGLAGAPEGLTPREAEVLAHIAAGESNAEIAAALVVSEATVKTHINHIFSKTGLRDRAQLVGYAFRHGLVFPG